MLVDFFKFLIFVGIGLTIIFGAAAVITHYCPECVTEPETEVCETIIVGGQDEE